MTIENECNPRKSITQWYADQVANGDRSRVDPNSARRALRRESISTVLTPVDYLEEQIKATLGSEHANTVIFDTKQGFPRFEERVVVYKNSQQ